MAHVRAQSVVMVLTPMIRGLKYIFLMKKFKSEKEKLISNRDLVVKKVEATNYKTEKVNVVVMEWLNEVRELIEEEENCFRSTEKEFQIYDPILLRKIKTLNTKCEFEPFSIPIPGIEYFSSRNFVCFESTEKASDQLLEALKEETSYIIGLYGMPGSGKTKLVKAVREKAKYLKIFDEIVFASVSQKPTVSIQDEIADCLGLKLDGNIESGRARKILLSLQSKERILVILDDVRAKFELEDIGLPCNGNQCKVLLTTRYQQVCTSMECQREIPLHPLSEEEAWMWFKKHSGIDDESPSNLLNVARDVAKVCKWLPMTIKDVGSSLKLKPIEEWNATLDNLRHSMARYHVFLSFRGQDTRYSFTGFLYRALCKEGFKTFMDDEGLQSGDQISQSLIEAIEDSRLSIIVFSENYASSTWCLDELVKILECKKNKNQLVWPIFYKVEPRDVRHQKNSYGNAMVLHENRFANDPEKVNKWKSALSEVTLLKGEHYETGYEHEFIQMIVEKANNIRSRLHIQSMD